MLRRWRPFEAELPVCASPVLHTCSGCGGDDDDDGEW